MEGGFWAARGLRVVETKHAGRGVFAGKNVDAGCTIIREPPLLLVPDRGSALPFLPVLKKLCSALPVKLDAQIFAAVLIFSGWGHKEQQARAAVLNLADTLAKPPQIMGCIAKAVEIITKLGLTGNASSSTHELIRCAQVACLCGMDAPDGSLAVFEHAALLNHSCVSNCDWGFETTSQSGPPEVVIRVVKSVEPAEELTISYFLEPRWLPCSTRQKELLQTKGFVCGCAHCHAADETRGFRCPSCDEGVVYVQGSDPADSAVAEANNMSRCTACGFVLEPAQVAAVAAFEAAVSTQLQQRSSQVHELKLEAERLSLKYPSRNQQHAQEQKQQREEEERAQELQRLHVCRLIAKLLWECDGGGGHGGDSGGGDSGGGGGSCGGDGHAQAWRMFSPACHYLLAKAHCLLHTTMRMRRAQCADTDRTAAETVESTAEEIVGTTDASEGEQAVAWDWEVLGDTLADALMVPQRLERKLQDEGAEFLYKAASAAGASGDSLESTGTAAAAAAAAGGGGGMGAASEGGDEGQGQGEMARRMRTVYQRALSDFSLLYGSEHQFFVTLKKKSQIFGSIARKLQEGQSD